jgi:hypothetical protein
MLKRRVGYNDLDDDYEKSQAAKQLRQMVIDPAE